MFYDPTLTFLYNVFISRKLINNFFNIDKPVIFIVRIIYQRVYVGTSPRKCKGRGRHSNNKVVAQKLGYALKPRLLITTLHPYPSPRTEIKLHPPPALFSLTKGRLSLQSLMASTAVVMVTSLGV